MGVVANVNQSSVPCRRATASLERWWWCLVARIRTLKPDFFTSPPDSDRFTCADLRGFCAVEWTLAQYDAITNSDALTNPCEG